MKSISILLSDYVNFTQNMTQLIQVMNQGGIENSNPHIRFRMIQWIPELIIRNYKKLCSKKTDIGSKDVPYSKRLSNMQEFHMMVEKLLVRAKGDRTDSIRIEAQ